MEKGILSLVLSSALIAGIIFFSPITTLAVYPDKSVTVLCGYPPGGSVDATARAITQAAKKYFPKPMVVVNRPGAGGAIGAAEMIQAKPDGYTIGLTPNSALTIQPHRTKLPYGSPEEYTPIINLYSLSSLIVVQSTSPWKTIQEFIAYARDNPGKVRVGHAGIGTPVHLTVEELNMKAKINLKPVPFAGSGESVPALLGGHVEAISTYASNVVPHVEAGKLRVLAVSQERRNPLFRDALTFKEIGYAITVGSFYLVIGPKGLPSQIVSTLHDALKKAMEDPIFTKFMEAGAVEVSYEGPQDLKNHLMQDYVLHRKLIDLFQLKGK